MAISTGTPLRPSSKYEQHVLLADVVIVEDVRRETLEAFEELALAHLCAAGQAGLEDRADGHHTAGPIGYLLGQLVRMAGPEGEDYPAGGDAFGNEVGGRIDGRQLTGA